MNAVVTRAVSTIGAAQVIASAAGHYLPAVVAVPAAQALGLGSNAVFLAFSWSMVVSALAGPLAGRWVDRFGGRPVLMLSNLSFILGLLLLGSADGPWGLLWAYTAMGLGMATGQFEVAFATLVKLFGRQSRNPITGITLIAGFASFIGWTVSVYVLNGWGWRGVCGFWAGVHLLIGLPLHALVPRPVAQDTTPRAPTDSVNDTPQRASPASTSPGPSAQNPWVTSVLLSYVFAASAFIGMGLMMHMPALLQLMGVSLALAFAVGSLVGPSQVLGRLIDFFLMRQWHPLVGTRLAALCHPVACGLLLILGAPVAALFVVLHGIGNGILIISRGTVPLAIFGTRGYGKRQGWLMLPAKLAQAAAPFLFGLALTHWGTHALWLTGGIALSVLAALCLIRKSAAT